jgi:MFS superfamily sulfate permease-like transporter
VADTSGGKTQLTSVVAAMAMALVLLLLTGPLALLPKAALAAILISSAIGLFDVASLRWYLRVSPAEFWLSIVAMLGVMTVGVLHGVLIAVALTLLRLIALASRPRDAVLGEVDEQSGLYGQIGEDGSTPIPGLLLFRFESGIVFFNADHFKERVRAVLSQANPKPRWFLFSAESTPILDITGGETLEELRVRAGRAGNCLRHCQAQGSVRGDAEADRRGRKDRPGANIPDDSCRGGGLSARPGGALKSH